MWTELRVGLFVATGNCQNDFQRQVRTFQFCDENKLHVQCECPHKYGVTQVDSSIFLRVQLRNNAEVKCTSYTLYVSIHL